MQQNHTKTARQISKTDFYFVTAFYSLYDICMTRQMIKTIIETTFAWQDNRHSPWNKYIVTKVVSIVVKCIFVILISQTHPSTIFPHILFTLITPSQTRCITKRKSLSLSHKNSFFILCLQREPSKFKRKHMKI